MSAGRPKLDDRAEAAIAGLLTERTHALAAAKAGISEATVARWLRDPQFKSAYKAARRAVVDSAVGRLQASAAKAVDALEKNLACGRPSDENRAAVAILEFSLKAVEAADLGERIDELEALLRSIQNGEPLDPPDEVDRGGAGILQEGGAPSCADGGGPGDLRPDESIDRGGVAPHDR